MIISKMVDGVANRKSTVIPFSGETVFLRPLSEYDTYKSIDYVNERYKGWTVGRHNVHERNSLRCTHDLWLALIDEHGKQVFASFDDLLKTLTAEQVNILYSELLTLQSEVNPSVDDMSESDMKIYIDEIKKKPAMVLNITDIRLLKKCLFFMVNQQKT